MILNKREHGGDPQELEHLYGHPEQGWLDLSTGINPQPYAPKKLDPGNWGSLPSTTSLSNLKQAAAVRYGVSNAQLITAAPGTQALIQWLPRMRPVGRVSVVSPTYNEHAHCWRIAEHTVKETRDLAQAEKNSDVIIVVNPNNPDGHQHNPNDLKSLAKRQAEKGGWLIVDEAFCDVVPELSVANAAGSSGLIILRSFGKFYGLAGLRLGFALTDAVVAERLSTFLGPWAVSTPAIIIGEEALLEDDWTTTTRQQLQLSSDRLDRLLVASGLEVVGSTTLYRLVATDRAEAIYQTLAQRGIMVRQFQYNPKWLRFGLPRREQDWRRLEVALRQSSLETA
jgi:cobalamin biosynthetic protein CobC